MNREIKKGEAPPPMSDEMELTVNLLAGLVAEISLKEISKNVAGEAKKPFTENDNPPDSKQDDLIDSSGNHE